MRALALLAALALAACASTNPTLCRSELAARAATGPMDATINCIDDQTNKRETTS